MTSPIENALARTIADLAAKLEGRDPIEAQGELLPALRRAVEGLTREQCVRPEGEGRWSIMEVVQHLADAELAYGWRIRMILAHDTPAIQGFDQDLWAKALDYRSVQLEEALAQLETLRRANLNLVRRQDEAALDRVGLHDEVGPMSVRMILYILANHDRTHLRQVERIKQTLGR